MTSERRDALKMAAADPTLPAWQRDIMLSITREKTPNAKDAPSRNTGGLSHRSTTATADDGQWIGILPSSLTEHSAIYDPVRDRMVVFGGNDGSYLRDDTWVLTLSGTPKWSALIPSGSPPPERYEHTAIYDPVRDRMVVFGGYDDSNIRNDVWALALSGTPAWTALAPTGSLPPGRYGHTAIYDPVRDRMLVFGGWDGSNYRNDVRALTLSGSPAWSALAPSGSLPPGRYSHSAIYDPVRDRMVVFAGHNGNYPSDVWVLTLSGSPAWSALAPSGSPPIGRQGHTAIYDPVRDRMVVFAGTNASQVTPYRNDVWALKLSGSPTWSALAPSGSPPPERYAHTVIYDPVRDRLLVFGGYDFSSIHDEVWALTLSVSPAWSALSPAGTVPPEHYGHAAIYDPVRQRMVVFGGVTGGNDVWALTLSGRPAWSMLAASGSPPDGHSWPTAIYDPVRDRMVVFGGADGAFLSNEVSALTLSGSPAWSAITPSGSPPTGRYGHSAIYDPVRDRMVMFGGYDGSLRNDVWALPLSGSPAWIALSPSGTKPTGRQWHAAIYDPLRDRMVMFAGFDDIRRNDVWALSLAGSPAWNALAPSGTAPTTRWEPTAVYDPVRDRMVVFAGNDISRRNDVWALSLAGSPAWTALAPSGRLPSERDAHTAIYDPVRDRMVMFGGFDGNYRYDVWALTWGSPPVAVDEDAIGEFSFAAPRPNPSRGPLAFDVDLTRPTHLVLDVFDTQGRRVKRVANERVAAGRRGFVWTGHDEDGQSVAAGVYFVHVVASDWQATRRVVRIP